MSVATSGRLLPAPTQRDLRRDRGRTLVALLFRYHASAPRRRHSRSARRAARPDRRAQSAFSASSDSASRSSASAVDGSPRAAAAAASRRRFSLRRRNEPLDEPAHARFRQCAGEFVHEFAVDEALDVRDSAHAVARRDLGTRVGVQLGEQEPAVVFDRELLQDRLERAAGCTPGAPRNRPGQVRSSTVRGRPARRRRSSYRRSASDMFGDPRVSGRYQGENSAIQRMPRAPRRG